MAHGGVPDVREPASHVSGSYRRRTSGEGGRRFEGTEASPLAVVAEVLALIT